MVGSVDLVSRCFLISRYFWDMCANICLYSRKKQFADRFVGVPIFAPARYFTHTSFQKKRGKRSPPPPSEDDKDEPSPKKAKQDKKADGKPGGQEVEDTSPQGILSCYQVFNVENCADIEC